MRMPQKPEELVDALNDPIHRDVGRSRPARTVRSRKMEVVDSGKEPFNPIAEYEKSLSATAERLNNIIIAIHGEYAAWHYHKESCFLLKNTIGQSFGSGNSG